MVQTRITQMEVVIAELAAQVKQAAISANSNTNGQDTAKPIFDEESSKKLASLEEKYTILKKSIDATAASELQEGRQGGSKLNNAIRRIDMLERKLAVLTPNSIAAASSSSSSSSSLQDSSFSADEVKELKKLLGRKNGFITIVTQPFIVIAHFFTNIGNFFASLLGLNKK